MRFQRIQLEMSKKLVAFVLLVSPFALLAQTPPPPAPPKCPPPIGHIDVANGTFSNQPGISFRLRHFSATLVPEGRTAPFCYGKITVVSHAEIFVDNASLTKVFSSKLSDSESKIQDFKVVNSELNVTLSGTIKKIIPIHFSIAGPVTTDGTGLLLRADKIKADGIPVKALLGLVGEHLSSVLGMKNVRGVTVQENTMTFLPEQIAHLKGHIQSVTTSSAGITLIYSSAPRASHHRAPAGSKASVPKP